MSQAEMPVEPAIIRRYGQVCRYILNIFHLRKNKLRVKKLAIEDKLCKDRNDPYKGLANFAGGGIEGD